MAHVQHDFDLSIPPPEPQPNGRPRVYPWPVMPVGSNILVEEDRAHSARSSARKWARENPGFRWVARVERLPNGRNALRIWRTN